MLKKRNRPADGTDWPGNPNRQHLGFDMSHLADAAGKRKVANKPPGTECEKTLNVLRLGYREAMFSRDLAEVDMKIFADLAAKVKSGEYAPSFALAAAVSAGIVELDPHDAEAA
jgi:hypothetical protein